MKAEASTEDGIKPSGLSGVSDHYVDVAEKYEPLYGRTMSNFLPVVQEALKLKPDDVLVDIGGGTGWYAHQLWKAAGLKKPVVCVDPSEDMLKIAKRKEGVTTVQATAEEFFSRPQEKLFTKAVSVGAIHHFNDVGTVLEGVWNSLVPGGSFVILTYSPNLLPGYPLFRAALARYAAVNFMSADELTRVLKASAPFKVHMESVKVQHEMPKKDWYSMLRGRYATSLHALSDEEIENGIAELERERFGALQDEDHVIQADSLFLAVLSKPAMKD